jgi:hypothetical protein
MRFKIIKKLRVFDFDDTLAVTDAKIRIVNKGLELSSKEFADYQMEPGDKIDLSDFQTGELINPRPTNFLKTAFRKIVGGDSDIMILTARVNTNGIKDFLSKYVDPDRLIVIGGKKGASGEETARLKRNAIASRLGDYDSIIFFDDSISNIEAVKSLNSPKIKTQLVKK